MDIDLKQKIDEAVLDNEIKVNIELDPIVKSLINNKLDGMDFSSKMSKDVFNRSEELIEHLVIERMGVLKKIYPSLTPEEIKTIFLNNLGEYKSKINQNDLIELMSEMETYECSDQGINQTLESRAKETIEAIEKDKELEISDKNISGPTMSDVSM